MKVTQQNLKQIIAEEVQRALKELAADPVQPAGAPEKQAGGTPQKQARITDNWAERESGGARAKGPIGAELFGKGARLKDAIYTQFSDGYYITHKGKRSVANPNQVKQIDKAIISLLQKHPAKQAKRLGQKFAASKGLA